MNTLFVRDNLKKHSFLLLCERAEAGPPVSPHHTNTHTHTIQEGLFAPESFTREAFSLVLDERPLRRKESDWNLLAVTLSFILEGIFKFSVAWFGLISNGKKYE